MKLKNKDMIYGPSEIQNLEKIESLTGPVIANFPGQRSVFFGNGKNYSITDDVTLEMVRSKWIKKDYQKSNKFQSSTKVKKWEVESSRPGKKYIVKLVNGNFSCTCKGYQFRGKCRHITEIKNQ